MLRGYYKIGRRGWNNCRQSIAAIKRPVADGADAVGDGHARQSSAAIKRPAADGGDAVGDGHIC